MGNCCRRESSATVWASVDELYGHEYPSYMEKESLIVVLDDVNGVASTPLEQWVRTKVTKRELEELVAIARAQDVPLDRVMSRLIHTGAQSQQSWEPVLDTITE